MGAKTSLVAQTLINAREVLSSNQPLDQQATTRLVASLFPGVSFGEPQRTDLSHTYVADETVVAGCFPGLSIVVAREVAIDQPSKLPMKYISDNGLTVLHAMHSVVDWFAFAVWESGVLRRSLSLAPDSGLLEDIGAPLPFELPYWRGEHPATDPDEEEDSYPLPFHPLELGEAALREFFGFQLEGFVDPSLMEPEQIAMLRFNVGTLQPPQSQTKKAWWKFWQQ